MKVKYKERTAFLSSVLVLLLTLGFLTNLLTPKQHDYGATWGHYLAEEKNSMDLLFFGSSLVYCDVVPAAIWEETGLQSYVMAGPEQTIPITYYYLKEALKTQSPQAVFVEITGVFYDRYTNFTKTNVGQMPWGWNRLQATLEEAEKETQAGLLFPLLFYHDRWSQLTGDDIRTLLNGYDQDLLAGYTPLTSYRQTNGVSIRNMNSDQENIARNKEYLEMIYDLCLEKNIIPVFFVAPTLARVEDTEMDALKTQISDWENAVLLDCNEYFFDIAAEEQGDFYDTLHYNVSGAVKFSAFLGQWSVENLELTITTENHEIWQRRMDYIHQLNSCPMELLEENQ